MDVLTPLKLRPRLSPSKKLNSVNKTTGLWSEVSINKIRTRSITFINTQVILDNNSSPYNIT